MTYLLLVVFSMLLAIGQVFFKKAAMAGADEALPWAFVNRWMALALVLYAVATLLWTWILRTTPLSVAYPFAALAILLVPMLSAYFFGEVLNSRVLIGAAIVVAGLVVSST